VLSQEVFLYFCTEIEKLSSNRITDALRVPGIANGTPRGLAKPYRAAGQNLARFQAAGPGKPMVTGTSTTAFNPASPLPTGTTGFVGTPAPPPVAPPPVE
jgi:hypothetical protein